MTHGQCRLIFRGEIGDGLDSQTVRDAVQSLLGCDEAALERLFSGRPVVIKSNLDPARGRKFKGLFEKTGAICHLVPQKANGSRPPEPAEAHTAAHINCPACGFEQTPAMSCLRCGIVIEKYRQRQTPETEAEAASVANSEPPANTQGSGAGPIPTNSLKDLLLAGTASPDPLLASLKALLLLGLLIWGCRFAFASITGNCAGESFMHLINTPFHEAGHVLFRPLGRFMTSLGGSLSQVLFPLICLFTLLLKNRDPFGGAICLWWAGQNFIDMAPYINDARAGVLPLLGGNTGQSSPYGFHDWEFLLTESGLLHFDHTFARLSHGFGSVVMALAIAWGTAVIYHQVRAGRKD